MYCNYKGQAVSSLLMAIRFPLKMQSDDQVFCNGVARLNDLSKESIIQAIEYNELTNFKLYS